MNVLIGCGGVAVFPNDIVVGDFDGVVIIPAHLADEIAAEAKGMEQYEAWVVAQVEAGRSIIGLYPANEATRAEFEAFMADDAVNIICRALAMRAQCFMKPSIVL